MFLKHYCLVKKYNKLAVNGQWTGQDLLCYIYTMLESDKKKKCMIFPKCCSKIGKKFVKSLWIKKNLQWQSKFHQFSFCSKKKTLRQTLPNYIFQRFLLANVSIGEILGKSKSKMIICTKMMSKLKIHCSLKYEE